MLAPRGDLLFVVPLGRAKVAFNGHRVYAFDQVISYFDELNLERFTLIPEDPLDGALIDDPGPAMVNDQSYGCGCFWFRK